ncbi:hypothetical protein J4Q44_G00323330, partial [Coregonus suidteri]
WNIAVGTCFHSATRELVRSGTDVGQLGLARSLRSNSSQRCSMELRFPFTGTKGPSTYHEKQPQTIIPPPPNFTVGTMHWCR